MCWARTGRASPSIPHGKHKHLLSVGLFLNIPQLEADKAKLAAMPVFKRGLYKNGELGYSFTSTS